MISGSFEQVSKNNHHRIEIFLALAEIGVLVNNDTDDEMQSTF
jgi:hypothetical protein